MCKLLLPTYTSRGLTFRLNNFSRALYRLVCLASCLLAADTIRGPGDPKDLPYLATAAGFFGRMALAEIKVPLEDITEIVRTAQESIKGKKPNKGGESLGNGNIGVHNSLDCW